jgi:hypothetical protein
MNTLFATTNWFSTGTMFGEMSLAKTVDQIWQQISVNVDLLSSRVVLAVDVAAEIDAVTYAPQSAILPSNFFQDDVESAVYDFAFSGEAEILGANAQLDLSSFEALLSPLVDVVDEGGFTAPLADSAALTTILSEETDGVSIPTIDIDEFTADMLYSPEIGYIEDALTGFAYATISDTQGSDGF